jgi:hypothetical protein
VYPSAGYAYGIATRYPIEKRSDSRAATDWVVKVRGPKVTILQANRETTERWGEPLDRIAARSPRVWLVGSHFFLEDWRALKQMLWDRGYRPVEAISEDGAQGALFVKQATSVTSPPP